MDLAAEMEQKRPVRNVFHIDAVDRAAGTDDRVRMIRVGREHGDVAHLAFFVCPDEVDRVQQSACVGDRAREIGERARTVLEANTECERERCGVVRHAASLILQSTGSNRR